MAVMLVFHIQSTLVFLVVWLDVCIIVVCVIPLNAAVTSVYVVDSYIE